MNDENIQDNEPKVDPVVDKSSQSAASILKGSVADGLKVLENTEPVTGNIRQIVDGGLLGVCIVFLATMLGLQHLDTLLTVALVAFSVAIPLLVDGFMQASYKVKAVPGSGLIEIRQSGASIAEGFGQIAVAVGVLAVIWHLSILALQASLLVYILVAPLSFLIAAIIILYPKVRELRSKEKEKTTLTASGDPPAKTLS